MLFGTHPQEVPIFDNKDSSVFEAMLQAQSHNAVLVIDAKAVQNCAVSKKPFRYIAQELQFYTKHHVPLPRVAAPLRYRERMQLMDTSFSPQEVVVNGQRLTCYYAHPQSKNIISDEEYAQQLS